MIIPGVERSKRDYRTLHSMGNPGSRDIRIVSDGDFLPIVRIVEHKARKRQQLGSGRHVHMGVWRV